MKIEVNEVYTLKEVAQLLKISVPTMKRMLKEGRLVTMRIGRQHRIMGKDIMDFLNASRTQAAVPQVKKDDEADHTGNSEPTGDDGSIGGGELSGDTIRNS